MREHGDFRSIYIQRDLTYRQRKEAIERRAGRRATGSNVVDLAERTDQPAGVDRGEPETEGVRDDARGVGMGRGFGAGRNSRRGPGRPRGSRSAKGPVVPGRMGVINPFSANQLRNF